MPIHEIKTRLDANCLRRFGRKTIREATGRTEMMIGSSQIRRLRLVEKPIAGSTRQFNGRNNSSTAIFFVINP